MNFNSKKKQYLEELYKPDKSKKGHVDERISSLLDKINALEDYVTTSSCSGRIDLLTKPKGSKKHDVNWPFVSHEIVQYEDIWNVLEEEIHKTDARIWLKMESPILHIMCRTVDAANTLVQLGFKAGFKYSGIFVIKKERVMVQIFGTEKIEHLAGDDKTLLLTKKACEIIIKQANEKLQKSHDKLDVFEESISKLSNDEK